MMLRKMNKVQLIAVREKFLVLIIVGEIAIIVPIMTSIGEKVGLKNCNSRIILASLANPAIKMK